MVNPSVDMVYFQPGKHHLQTRRASLPVPEYSNLPVNLSVVDMVCFLLGLVRKIHLEENRTSNNSETQSLVIRPYTKTKARAQKSSKCQHVSGRCGILSRIKQRNSTVAQENRTSDDRRPQQLPKLRKVRK